MRALADEAPLKIKITAMGIFSFLCAAFASFKINLVGEIFVTEVLLLLVGVAAFAAGGASKLASNRAFWLLFVAALMSLSGYMMSDMVRGTPSDLYIRGWARNVVIISSFVALSLLFSADKRNLWWFALGFGVGGVLYSKVVLGLPVGGVNEWKFAYSSHLTLIAACSAAVLPLRVTGFLLLALGAYSMVKDNRIHGAVCMLVGCLSWIATMNRGRLSPKIVIGVGVAGLVTAVAAAYLLETTRSSWHDQRREASNTGRLLGLKLGVTAVTHSPVIGYGSWGRNPDLLRIGADIVAEHEATTGRPFKSGALNSAHSQLLNAWIEGGIFGASLFFAMFFLLLRESWFAALRRPGDILTPLLLYIVLFEIWHLINSPLGANIRIYFSLSMAALVVLYAERKLAERAARPAVARGVAPRSGRRLITPG